MLRKLLSSLMIAGSASAASAGQQFYDFEFKTIEGKTIRAADLKNKVVLVVNTASKCGFTPQLGEIEQLYRKYKSQGFEVLAFPSDDFKQEFDAAQEVQKFATEKYQVTFPLMEKVKVRGRDKHPFFQFLIDSKKGTILNEISWNFEKFLIDRQGNVVERYSSMTSPTGKIEEKIKSLLKSEN